MKMILKLFVFLLLNFAALALGSVFTAPGVTSTWYQQLNQAPWTPPPWVFGMMWTGIMLTFSVYMALLFSLHGHRKRVSLLFVCQWLLNVGWCAAFFYFRSTFLGLWIILSLTLLMMYLFVAYRHRLSYASLLVVPYWAWLLVACSLNAYIVCYN